MCGESTENGRRYSECEYYSYKQTILTEFRSEQLLLYDSDLI